MGTIPTGDHDSSRIASALPSSELEEKTERSTSNLLMLLHVAVRARQNLLEQSASDIEIARAAREVQRLRHKIADLALEHILRTAA
jgi:hypothetical protein